MYNIDSYKKLKIENFKSLKLKVFIIIKTSTSIASVFMDLIIGWVVFYGILTFVGYLMLNSVYIYDFQWIGQMSRVFANGPGDQGSIPGRVIPKTQKMVLDGTLLYTQQYKIRIKSKVEQSREAVAPSPIPRYSSY